MTNGKMWLLAGAIFGALVVMLGAFGAHLLQDRLQLEERRLANWETAVRYQLYHALALLVIGILCLLRPTPWLHAAGAAFVFGILVFSGCLYLLVLTETRWLGAIVPIGGVSLIIGWLLLAVAVVRA